MTSGSPTGVAPPARPVPLPRATNGRPCRAATRTAAATSAPRRREAHRGRCAPVHPGVALVERELQRLRTRLVRLRARPRGRPRARGHHQCRRYAKPTDERCLRSARMSARQTRSGPTPGMGDLRRPQRRRPALADRCDVPHVALAVHLRPRLPGRAHRARSGDGAGVLLLRRALLEPEGPRPRRARRQGAVRRRVAVRQGGQVEGHLRASAGRTRRDASSGVPGSSTTRASS